MRLPKLFWDNQQKRSRLFWRSKLEGADEMMQNYRERIDLNYEDAAAHYGLGNCLYAIGEYDYARDEWTIASVIDNGEIGDLAREQLEKLA